jgi:hypothetical protein
MSIMRSVFGGEEKVALPLHTILGAGFDEEGGMSAADKYHRAGAGAGAGESDRGDLKSEFIKSMRTAIGGWEGIIILLRCM